MAEILLLHHALGLTPGVEDFADRLRGAGHAVHTPDLFDGRTFEDVGVGLAFVQEIGDDHLSGLAGRAADRLPSDIVYAGFSLGGMLAEGLALTRAGCRGCLLFHTGVPVEHYLEDRTTWPDDLPLQMHITAEDVYGDTPVCRALADGSPAAELVLYPGSAHLFAETGYRDHDPELADQMTARTLEFLARVG